MNILECFITHFSAYFVVKHFAVLLHMHKYSLPQQEKHSPGREECSLTQSTPQEYHHKSSLGLYPRQQHMLIPNVGSPESSETIYNCNVCTNRFTTSNALQAHMQKQHGLAITNMCCYCENFCESQDTLRNHITAYHKSAEPLQCQECEMTCTSGEELQVHTN